MYIPLIFCVIIYRRMADRNNIIIIGRANFEWSWWRWVYIRRWCGRVSVCDGGRDGWRRRRRADCVASRTGDAGNRTVRVCARRPQKRFSDHGLIVYGTATSFSEIRNVRLEPTRVFAPVPPGPTRSLRPSYFARACACVCYPVLFVWKSHRQHRCVRF